MIQNLRLWLYRAGASAHINTSKIENSFKFMSPWCTRREKKIEDKKVKSPHPITILYTIYGSLVFFYTRQHHYLTYNVSHSIKVSWAYLSALWAYTRIFILYNNNKTTCTAHAQGMLCTWCARARIIPAVCTTRPRRRRRTSIKLSIRSIWCTRWLLLLLTRLLFMYSVRV